MRLHNPPQSDEAAIRKKQVDFDLLMVKANSVTFDRDLDPGPQSRSLRNVMAYRVGCPPQLWFSELTLGVST